MHQSGVRRRVLSGLLAVAVLSACAPALVQAQAQAQAQAAPAAAPHCLPGSPEVKQAKPRKTEPLDIATAKGVVHLKVEMAATESERSQGLMCRRAMAPEHGMLFDFKAEKPVYFWMKNTILPLDMLFIAGDGRIVAVAPNTTPFSEDAVGPGVPVLGVLEIGAGRAAALGVMPGDRVRHRIFKGR